MADETQPDAEREARIAAAYGPRRTSRRAKMLRLAGLLSIVGLVGFIGAAIALKGSGFLAPPPPTDRQRLVAADPPTLAAVKSLDQEPCQRDAFGRLLQAYQKKEMLREMVGEIAAFEAACGPFPDVRVSQVRALADLSDFPAALKAADILVAESPTTPNAWSVRADIRDKLGDLDGAGLDLRQSLALFPNPARIGADGFFRLSDVLSRQKRFCEAAAVLATYASFDAAARRTKKIRATLADFRNKGKCTEGSKTQRIAIRLPAEPQQLTVEADINGVTGIFVVDTAATLTTVSQDFATRAGLRPDPSRTLAVAAGDGSLQAIPTAADTIALRGLTTRKAFVLVNPPTAKGPAPDIDGLLGLSFLANFDFQVQSGILRLAVPED